VISAFKGVSLPITRKLNPLRRENLLYMAETAVLTRLSIALMRTWQNVPSKNNNPEASQLDKHKSLWERFFIEILGTSGYMLAMHLGQDLMAKWLETRTVLNPNKMLEGIEGLSIREMETLTDKVHKVFGDSPKGIVSRVLYGKANLANLYRELGTSRLAENTIIRDAVEGYAKRLNRFGAYTLLAGIAAGVAFGGVVVQFVNDRFFGPVVEPFLARLFGLDRDFSSPTPSPAGSPGWVAFDQQPSLPGNRLMSRGKMGRPVGPLNTHQRTFEC
jgi:hypothetical protein